MQVLYMSNNLVAKWPEFERLVPARRIPQSRPSCVAHLCSPFRLRERRCQHTHVLEAALFLDD